MSSYNKVLLMGNLTRDIELRYTPNNQAVANLGLAVNRTYKSKEGEKREEVSFIDCEAWGRTAEVMQQYLRKGRPVFVEGRLKLDQWEDKDGGKRSKLKVVIENFQFIDSKSDGGGSGGGGGGGSYQQQQPQPQQQQYQQQQQPVPAGAPAAPQTQPIGEDDIPF